MALKTYVLLEHLHPTAQIYQQVNKDQRVRLNTLPQWEPNLQMTFLDMADEVTDYDPKSKTFGKKIPNEKKGQNRTIRLKLNSNTPYQDEQIEKEKIPANEKFTQMEYDARKFRHNTLTTDNPVVQRFLEVSPWMEGFKGTCPEVPRPCFKLYDKNVEIVSENRSFKDRLKAANKIADLDLEKAQEMLIRIFGTFYTVPDTLEEAQNALVNFMDEGDEAMDEILKEDTTLDDEVQIILGKLVSAGILSFDAVQGQVCKKKGDNWIELKAIGNEYTPMERQRYFIEFLTSPAGKLLLDDLRKDATKKVKEKELVS